MWVLFKYYQNRILSKSQHRGDFILISFFLVSITTHQHTPKKKKANGSIQKQLR